MAQHHFEPQRIPKQVTFTLYLTYGVGHWNRGKMSVTDYYNKDPEPRRKDKYSRDYETVLLSEFQLTIDIPEGIDPTQRYIQVLKNERRKLLSAHHMELKRVDDYISKVSALEYKPKQDVSA